MTNISPNDIIQTLVNGLLSAELQAKYNHIVDGHSQEPSSDADAISVSLTVEESKQIILYRIIKKNMDRVFKDRPIKHPIRDTLECYFEFEFESKETELLSIDAIKSSFDKVLARLPQEESLFFTIHPVNPYPQSFLTSLFTINDTARDLLSVWNEQQNPLHTVREDSPSKLYQELVDDLKKEFKSLVSSHFFRGEKISPLQEYQKLAVLRPKDCQEITKQSSAHTVLCIQDYLLEHLTTLLLRVPDSELKEHQREYLEQLLALPFSEKRIEDLRENTILRRFFPEQMAAVDRVSFGIPFGAWAGDKDGNPMVTAEIVDDLMQTQRRIWAVEQQLEGVFPHQYSDAQLAEFQTLDQEMESVLSSYGKEVEVAPAMSFYESFRVRFQACCQLFQDSPLSIEIEEYLKSFTQKAAAIEDNQDGYFTNLQRDQYLYSYGTHLQMRDELGQVLGFCDALSSIVGRDSDGAVKSLETFGQEILVSRVQNQEEQVSSSDPVFVAQQYIIDQLSDQPERVVLAKLIFTYRRYESEHSLLICSNAGSDLKAIMDRLSVLRDCLGIRRLSLLFEDHQAMVGVIKLMSEYIESGQDWPYDFVLGTAGSDNQKKMGFLLSDALNNQCHAYAEQLGIEAWFGRGCSEIRSSGMHLGRGVTVQPGAAFLLRQSESLMRSDTLRVASQGDGWDYCRRIGSALEMRWIEAIHTRTELMDAFMALQAQMASINTAFSRPAKRSKGDKGPHDYFHHALRAINSGRLGILLGTVDHVFPEDVVSVVDDVLDLLEEETGQIRSSIQQAMMAVNGDRIRGVLSFYYWTLKALEEETHIMGISLPSSKVTGDQILEIYELLSGEPLEITEGMRNKQQDLMTDIRIVNEIHRAVGNDLGVMGAVAPLFPMV